MQWFFNQAQNEVILDSVDTENLNEVIISATRTNRQLASVPLPTQLISNKALAAYIQNNIFSEVETVNENLFIQDSANGLAIPTGSGNGWYNYTGSPDHLIVPIPGKTLVFRTRDFKYAKVEILSYYKDSDSSIAENARYYTFNYLYQPDENLNSF